MLNGIYHVTFSSNSNDSSEGLLVFRGGTINGGDHGYLYTGTMTSHSETFKSTLTIKQWNPSVKSVFGSVKQFVLELSGRVSADNGFTASGQIAEQPQAKITIRGRYLSALTE
jgi:hypothetical protein